MKNKILESIESKAKNTLKALISDIKLETKYTHMHYLVNKD
ncbi:hypothetical protein [Mycoplasmopsis agalactiae]|nr:hypothetical protein [Mycoplasmopsis agalactiae]